MKNDKDSDILFVHVLYQCVKTTIAAISEAF